jgi:hypothetical protein
LEVGRSLDNVTAIDVIDCHVFDGPGVSFIVDCPSGSAFTYCIRNQNDGVGNHIYLGVTEAPTYALAASPSTVNPGQAITVTWTAPSGQSALDWIGLYKVGDPDMGYSAWQHTGGTQSGNTTFTAPSQTGEYEFRYFLNNGYTKVATSNTVTVGGSP